MRTVSFAHALGVIFVVIIAQIIRGFVRSLCLLDYFNSIHNAFYTI